MLALLSRGGHRLEGRQDRPTSQAGLGELCLRHHLDPETGLRLFLGRSGPWSGLGTWEGRLGLGPHRGPETTKTLRELRAAGRSPRS